MYISIIIPCEYKIIRIQELVLQAKFTAEYTPTRILSIDFNITEEVPIVRVIKNTLIFLVLFFLIVIAYFGFVATLSMDSVSAYHYHR